MNRTILALAFPALVMQAQAETPTASTPSPLSADAAKWRLVWHDEFDGAVLDTTKWTADAKPNRGGHNTPEAVTVRDGFATITTFTDNGKHCTGYLLTAGKFETAYGYFEARIRFHTTPGQWGAFWLAPPSLGKPLGDVAKAGVEIDIVEHRAMHGLGEGAGKDARGLRAMALHWDGYGEHHKSTGHGGEQAPGEPSLQGNWHTYAVLWTPERYVFYLNGKEQWTTNAAVSQRPEYLLLTCEVEDKGWAGAVPEGGFGSRESSQTKMEVDWVRVWQTAGVSTK